MVLTGVSMTFTYIHFSFVVIVTNPHSVDIIKIVIIDSLGDYFLFSFSQYYAECHGVIYVVDSSDSENLAISSQTFSTLVT